MLYMRSASSDTTLRARIRDAAVLLFGRDGYAHTSVRAIAAEAGVSPALVIHHFGSKDALRGVCDEHIVSEIFGRNDELGIDASSDALASTMQRWLADLDTHRVALDYLSRMLTDGSALGDQLFDNLVDRTEKLISDEVTMGRMRTSSDPRMTAALIATQSLVPLLLERHLSRALGADGLTAQLIERMTVPTLELYTHGLYTDDTLLDAARTAFPNEQTPSDQTATDQTRTDQTPHGQTAHDQTPQGQTPHDLTPQERGTTK